jgi:hypothetical protein
MAKYTKAKMGKGAKKAWSGPAEQKHTKKVVRLEGMAKRQAELEKMGKSSLIKIYEGLYKEKHSGKNKKALVQGILRYEGYFNR